MGSDMPGRTRTLLQAWCFAVILFGGVFALAAFPMTDGVARASLAAMGGAEPAMTDAMRFAVGLMGAVTMGWGFTLLAAVNATEPAAGRALWRGITWAAAAWYVVDSAISLRTGFALNVASNTLLFAAYLLAVRGTGAFQRS